MTLVQGLTLSERAGRGSTDRFHR